MGEDPISEVYTSYNGDNTAKRYHVARGILSIVVERKPYKIKEFLFK
jgi:hypothetical protein